MQAFLCRDCTNSEKKSRMSFSCQNHRLTSKRGAHLFRYFFYTYHFWDSTLYKCSQGSGLVFQLIFVTLNMFCKENSIFRACYYAFRLRHPPPPRGEHHSLENQKRSLTEVLNSDSCSWNERLIWSIKYFDLGKFHPKLDSLHWLWEARSICLQKSAEMWPWPFGHP